MARKNSFLYGILAVALGTVIYRILLKPLLEGFNVPVKPSTYQDKRFVTPAGNTIVY